ncbi:hypothetical protein ACQP04_15050 [Pseudonocardia halophobica]|uniref:hypothetical protein n=1 Tax=Pseudonocardia halophobica TaxID=29401 RepID=UPI003D9495FC
MGLMLVCFSSTAPSTLPALFPTEIRYGGLSITFNLFVSAFAGTAATVIGALVLTTGDLDWPGYYLMAAGAVGAISVWLLAESARKPLAGSGPAVSSEAEARALIAERQATARRASRTRRVWSGSGAVIAPGTPPRHSSSPRSTR